MRLLQHTRLLASACFEALWRLVFTLEVAARTRPKPKARREPGELRVAVAGRVENRVRILVQL